MPARDNILSQKIEFVKGVGEVRAKLLQSELGVRTVEDMITIFPFRYDDRSSFHLIKDIRHGDQVQLEGEIISLEKVKGKQRSRLTGLFKDQSGLIELTWFQGVKWVTENLKLNTTYILNGKVNVYKGKRSIVHPEIEVLEKAQAKSAFLPVYPSTEKLNTRGVGMKARRAILQTIFSQLSDRDFTETLPSQLLGQLKLCSRYQSYYWIHFPDQPEQITQATNRLKFEELFFLQLRILQQKKLKERKLIGIKFDQIGQYFNKFYHERLEFELTGAQKRVIKEIRYDMGRGVQMNRLLQGDVGSGKTIVALMSMLIAIDNGYQACLLAPTEILAQQHFQSFSEGAKGIGVQIAYLSGSVKGKTRKELLYYLKEGHIDILIGTHALLEDPVLFKKLGLAVTDEQHRFGVEQRSKLWMKNKDIPPHILVMTATPIPRTLAMTAYGDLDVSVIDELPPGRKPVKTVHRTDGHRSFVVKFMKEEIAKGRQVYIVYPLIDESETLDLQNLQTGYEELLTNFSPPDYQIAVVHGRMKPQDKDLEMQRFVSGRAQLMVATTVIEVGVNVPNASIMIIENAERFGLSQLHQLRGRVGRGADQSFCILITKTGLSEYARKRIKTMCETNDGFKIAEVDMQLRGPGDIEGTQQSGVMDLKIADIAHDGRIMETARHFAIKVLQVDTELNQAENAPLKKHLNKLKLKNQNWGRIS